MKRFRSILLSVVGYVAVASFASEAPPGYTTVDVMIVYTPAALAHVGGVVNMDAMIADVIRQANEVHQNSDTQVYLNLVHSAQTDYVESGYAADLYKLTDDDGQPNSMDEVHALRDQYKADFVCLFSYRTDTKGVAWYLKDPAGKPEEAFSYVSVYYDPAYNYTFVQNLGLNMGCGYSKTQAWLPSPPPGLFPYSAGWQWSDSQSPYDGYCSVMTFEDFDSNGTDYEYKIVPHFSNPNVNYTDGSTHSTGDPVGGDNARTIREMRSVFAGYRDSDGDPPPPPPPLTTNYAYSISFENGFDGWSDSGGDFSWIIQTGETPTPKTGPSSAGDGIRYVYTESAGHEGQTAWLSKTFDFTSVSALELGFMYQLNGSKMGTLSVAVSTNNGAQWNQLWSVSGHQSSAWRQMFLPLTEYEGQSNVTIRFAGLVADSRTSDMAMDLMTITGEVALEDDGDQDDDGLPDEWELLYSGSATAADPAMTVSNGVNTLLEAYVAGLDPTDPDAIFTITLSHEETDAEPFGPPVPPLIVPPGEGGYVIHWASVSNRVYSVWWTPGLTESFQPLATNIVWPQSSYTDTVFNTESFYRVDVRLAE